LAAQVRDLVAATTAVASTSARDCTRRARATTRRASAASRRRLARRACPAPPGRASHAAAADAPTNIVIIRVDARVVSRRIEQRRAATTARDMDQPCEADQRDA